MKNFAVLCCLGLLLTACGGSSGGGGGGGGGTAPLPTSAITVGSSVNGTLSSLDIEAPDGSFLDLYTFAVATPTEVRIRLASATFDTYLFLLEGAGLADTDLLNNWATHGMHHERNRSHRAGTQTLQTRLRNPRKTPIRFTRRLRGCTIPTLPDR